MVGFLKLLVSMGLYGNMFHHIKITRNSNMVYRAYRVPYEWVPQLEKPGGGKELFP